MEEDIDEVLLRLTNKSVMHDKSSAKYEFTSAKNVVDLESESDDCCTSVSQRPVNPLSVLGTSASNSLPLPTVKMVTYDRFWQGQAEHVVANDNKEDFSELSSSVGTFSAESKKKHPVIFSEWCPILRNKKLRITGVTIEGNVDSRSIDRRISGYIFYDTSEVPCSLGGPMTHLSSQPKFIKHKFALGIPEDWVQVQSIWNRFEKLGSPNDFAWLSSTDLDTSDDLTVTEYDISSRRLTTSTPRNNTIGFCNLTTDISNINAADGLRTCPQRLFPNPVNATASRSMRKTYTSAALKKKMNKIRSMLKVTLMRESSKLTSFKELDELQDSDLNMRPCHAEVPVDKGGAPHPKPIISASNSEYLWQNKLPDHLVIKHLSKNNANMPTTSQTKVIDVAKCENSNQTAINNHADSLKPATNVFLNKSQFASKSKNVKDISASAKNSDKTKLQGAETSRTTIATVADKCREYATQKDNLPGEMSELCVSANQSSTANSSEQKLVKNSAVCKVSVNSAKKSTPPAQTSSSDDGRNYIPSQIFSKHRDSLTLLLDQNGVADKSASSNSSEVDNLDVYPTNSDSVVISYHHVNQTSVASDGNSVQNNSLDGATVSRPLKKSLTENTRNYKVIQSEERHLKSSSEDSIFSVKSRKAANTNKEKLNTPVYETSVNKYNRDVNQTTREISNVTTNLSIPHCDKNVINNNVRQQKVIRNRIIFSSESSDDDEQNVDQRTKTASTNVEPTNSDKRLNLGAKIVEPKVNTSNSEASDDDSSVNSIQISKTVTQSSNLKSRFDSESSDSNETEESHVKIVTNAMVHSALKARVKRSIVSATFNSNIHQSGTRINKKVICEDSNEVYTNENLEIISRAKEPADDKSANRSNNRIKSPEKRNRDSCSVEGKGKKQSKGKKSQAADEVTNQNLVQVDSRMQFTEEIIEVQSVPQPKQTPKSSKKRNNAKRDTGTIQNATSISTNLTLETDASLNNTTFSQRGRARCPTLPFWTGARFVTIGDETMVTNVSALNSSHKTGEKRLLTPQTKTPVDKRARTKTVSPVKVLSAKLSVLSSASNAKTEQQNNIRAGPSKNTKSLCSTSKNKTEKPAVRTPVNTKLNRLPCSSNDNRSDSFVDNVRNSNPIRNSPSRSKYNKINDSDVSSSEICSPPLSTYEKQNPNKTPTKSPRTVSKKNMNKRFHNETKCSPKSKKTTKETLNKVRKHTTINVNRDTNMSIVQENGKRQFSPKIKPNKTNDIYSPVQHEADTNIRILNDFCASPMKSSKKIKLSSKDSGVEVNNINYADELMEYESFSRKKSNVQLQTNTTLQMATEVIGNKNEIDARSKSTKKRNAKTKEVKRSVEKGDNKSSTLNTNNHTRDMFEVNFIKPATENRRNKKTGHKHEVNAEDVVVKQLRSRDVSLETINSSCRTNLKLRASVEARTKISTSKPLKSPALNSPKKLTKTSKRATHEIVVPELSPEESRESRDPNKRHCQSDSVSLPSAKPKRSAKKSKNDDNSTAQSIVTNSSTDKRKTLKNKEKITSNELVIFKEPAKKSKKVRQNTTEDKDLSKNRSKRGKKSNNMTDDGLDCNFSGSSARKTGKHKTNATQTADRLYDGYVNNGCITLVTRLSVEEIEKFTKHKSPEPLAQNKMNKQEAGCVSHTINGKISHSAEKNVSSSSKAKSSSKKPRKQKSFGEMYFGDPVKMPLMIKLKRKRQSKEKQSSVNTTNVAGNSNSMNNVTRKSGKRKLYNESDWLNSQECLQTFTDIVEPRRAQNFCLQLETNKPKHDYFDDDVISEVAALAKV